MAEILAELGLVEELRKLCDDGSIGSDLLVAQTLAGLGRIDEGAAVLRARTGSADHYRELIKFLVDHGRADAALTALRARPYRLSPHFLGFYYVARLLDEQGRPNEAIEVLRQDGGAYAQLADLLAVQGHVDEAIQVLNGQLVTARIGSINPATVAEQLADLLVEHQRIDELRARAEEGTHRVFGDRLAELR
jgi:hypothetical protein